MRSLVLTALLLGCSSKAPEAEPLRLGIAIPSYVHAVAWIAADSGLFGGPAEVTTMGGSAAAMRSLVAGTSDVVVAGGDSALKATLAGADLVIVGGLVDRFYHRVVAREALGELKGGRVGLPFLGGPQDMAVKHALSTLGLRYGEDVKILDLGRDWNGMAALARGDVEATTSALPPSRLEAIGLKVLVDLPSLETPFPYATVVVKRAFLKAHPERVRATLKGLCAAVKRYREDEAGSLKLVRAHLPGGTPEEAAEAYRVSGPALISKRLAPSEAGLQRVLDAIGTDAAKALKPTAVLDLSLLEALEAEGSCPR